MCAKMQISTPNQEISRISLDSYEGSTGCFACQALDVSLNQPTIKQAWNKAVQFLLFLFSIPLPRPQHPHPPPSIFLVLDVDPAVRVVTLRRRMRTGFPRSITSGISHHRSYFSQFALSLSIQGETNALIMHGPTRGGRGKYQSQKQPDTVASVCLDRILSPRNTPCSWRWHPCPSSFSPCTTAAPRPTPRGILPHYFYRRSRHPSRPRSGRVSRNFGTA